MSLSLTSYSGNLTRLLASMQISDASGKMLQLDEGAQIAIKMIADTKASGNKAMVVGNGGSAAIASHLQNDLCKAVRIPAIVFTEQPLLTALSNDESYQTAYESCVKLWAAKGDLLIAISSSGKSENILRSARAARERGCGVITMSGFGEDNPLRCEGDVNFYVPSSDYGPVEILHAALAQFLTDAVKIN